MAEVVQLERSVPYEPAAGDQAFFDAVPSSPAVFSLFSGAPGSAPVRPYLARTRNLRRRLARLLGERLHASRLISLREITRRIDYQPVGSSFEAMWLLYRLNRFYYPDRYAERLRLKAPALLKVNLRNRFPRCYATRRLSADGSIYYGPFASLADAERFAAEFLDFFKVRRCVDDLDPDPCHPGCIYSQMRMCLAPCFAGCTDADYRHEVGRLVQFLDSDGRMLVRRFEEDRAQASEALDFEQAAKIHRKLAKVREVIGSKPNLVRSLGALHAIVIQPGAVPGTIVFFGVSAGELRDPVTFDFEERTDSPVPLDERLRKRLQPAGNRATENTMRSAPQLPPWEHLALLARWYYSSFREGEVIMLASPADLPCPHLIRACRRLMAARQSEHPQTPPFRARKT